MIIAIPKEDERAINVYLDYKVPYSTLTRH